MCFHERTDIAMEKMRVAVIGYGGMGGSHVDSFANSEVVELAGIWDIDEKRIEAAKSKGIHAYSSLEDLLSDKSVDIVTIATPNDVHKDIAITSMAAGKHVICEKPVAMNSSELREMIDASHKYDRLFTVHQNRRWDNDFIAIRDLCLEGKLGKVFEINSYVQGSRGVPGDWRKEKEHGGGMMLDWGVHLIDQILQIKKDVKIDKIFSVSDHITCDEVDDGIKTDIFFEDGTLARVVVGTSNFLSMPRFYVCGMSGAARITTWGAVCQVAVCTSWEDEAVKPVKTAAGITKTMAPRDAKTVEYYDVKLPDSDVHDFYRNVVKAIHGEEEQLVKHDEVMRVMLVMEAAIESDRIGNCVKFNDII